MKIMTRIIIWINVAYKYSNFTKFNKWIYLLKLQKRGKYLYKKKKSCLSRVCTVNKWKGGKEKHCDMPVQKTCFTKENLGSCFKKYLLEYYKRSSVSPALSCVKMKECWSGIRLLWETDMDTTIFNFRGFIYDYGPRTM